MTKPRKRGLMASVLSRMAAGDCLISDRHAETMLFGLLNEAENVTDPSAAWNEVRSEVMASWGWEDAPEGPSKPFIYQDGVAVIPVHGILINRFNYCWGFVTGYDFIRKQMNAAEADEDVRLIVFDHDSPGGEAAGCDEVAREIAALETPTMALVNSLSASGGYWLAAPCDRIVCAPSGSVGSIGVYILVMNMAKMLAEWGLEAEFIKNGEFKVSGNSYEQMSDRDREYLQSMVDERATEFHRAVAEFRGIEESVVKDTQARVMRPTEALALGLIDAAESPTTAVASFVAELANSPSEPTDDDDSQEEVQMAEISSEDRVEIANQTKARIKGIMTHEEAKGREGLAEHLAYNTDMSVEEAAAMLKAAPKAEAEKSSDEADEEAKGGYKDGKKKDEEESSDEKKDDKASAPSHFENAMDNSNHPNVGPDAKGGGAGDGDAVSANVARILGAQSAATGRKFEQAKA